MQARRISRELALLSISQLPASPNRLGAQTLDDMLLASVRTLREEVHDTLEKAAAELRQGHQQLLASELNARSIEEARTRVEEALKLAQQAVNRVGASLELPEFVRLADDRQVRDYASALIGACAGERQLIDTLLDTCIEGWQVERLTRIDRDILRIATAEMAVLKSVPYRVSIDEALELAKKYSSETAPRFINGALRQVVQHLKLEQTAPT